MRDSAGVWIPPPLICGACLELAIGLQRFLPLPQPPRALVGVPAAVCAVVAGLIGFGAFFLFLALRVNPMPEMATTKLVLRGPFRFTRNPMYLGLVLLYAAFGLPWACLWTLVLAPVLVWVMTAYAVRREERYLEAKFGDAYRAYCARVRRWI